MKEARAYIEKKLELVDRWQGRGGCGVIDDVVLHLARYYS